MKFNLNGKDCIVVEGEFYSKIILDTEGVITCECGCDKKSNARKEIDEYTIIEVSAPTLFVGGAVKIIDGKKGKCISQMLYKKKSLSAMDELVSALEANNAFVAMMKDEYTDKYITDTYGVNNLKITNDGKLALALRISSAEKRIYFHTPEDVDFVVVSDDGVHIKYKNKKKKSFENFGEYDYGYGYYAVTNKAKKFKKSADAFAENLRDLGYKVKRLEKFMKVIDAD